ncbi:MAG: RDD family protein [Deltaproteobacteria bacterium]|nr:RDD family protein [Deltaproteobacteria bacterium]
MSEHDPDQPALPRLAPAPLGPRIGAGAFDAFAVVGLGFLLFWIPFRVGAASLPVWALIAAVLGYAVVPLAAFQATLGMRLFGLELVSRDGTPPDFLDLLFREVIGRGYGPAAYLGAVVLGLIASMVGAAQFSAVLGGMGWGFALCSLLLMAAGAGHLVAFGHPDNRTLADLLGKTMVIPRTVAAQQTDADADERAMLATSKRNKMIGLVVFEVALVLGTVGLPFALSTRVKSNQEYAQDLKLDADAHRFEDSPSDQGLAVRLASEYEERGQLDKAKAVRDRFEAARRATDNAREASLRKRLAEAPTDTDAADTLVDLLEDQNRMADARTVREASYKADPSPEAQASFGVWLYNHDLNQDAVAQLRASIAGGFDEGEAHAYLGMALGELGQKIDARHELHVALEKDPDLDQVRDELDALEQEIGPEPVAKPKLVKPAGKHH